MKKRQILSLVILIFTILFIGYEINEDRQIINLMKGFSRSTACEIMLSDGTKIIINGSELKNIIKKGVGFVYDDKGRKTYKDQEMVTLMDVKLYRSNKMISKLQIKEIVSSGEAIDLLYKSAPLPEPSANGKQNQGKYYDLINGRKIIVISGKYYCRGINEFLQPLFDYLDQKGYSY